MHMENEKSGIRRYLILFAFFTMLGGALLLNLFLPGPEILKAERRKPAGLPKFSVNSVADGSFMNGFEAYAADHFVFREEMRSIRSFMILDLFLMKDKSGIYRDRSVGIGEIKKTDLNALTRSAGKINSAAEILRAQGLNVYYSIIPDKSIFAERYLPGFDPDRAEQTLSAVLGEGYISLTDTLNAESFYKTDLHWNQTEIKDTAALICSRMGTVFDVSGFTEENAGEFRGVYPGQLALPYPADNMSFLDLREAKAYYLNEKTLQYEPGPVYEPEKIYGIDPYDVFLRGPQPLIILENPAAPERELYLFRDSFASSLAPLLASGYSKITIVDLRYISWDMLNELTDFTPGADALFIYSPQILANPGVLLI